MKANSPSRVALEECAPNVFIVHDIRVRPFLHGEGTYDGNRFVLTSWRRDGIFARIRERGLDVASLDTQITTLPALPAAPRIAEHPRWQGLGHPDERWSYYDPTRRTVAACDAVIHDQQHGVWIHPGWVVRRRRGRGAGDWYRSAAQGAHALQYTRIDDDAALLCGLAQAARYPHPPLPITWQAPDVVVIVTPLIPLHYQQCAKRWATGNRDGTTWQMPAAHLVWMQRLLSRLGIASDSVHQGESNA